MTTRLPLQRQYNIVGCTDFKEQPDTFMCYLGHHLLKRRCACKCTINDFAAVDCRATWSNKQCCDETCGVCQFRIRVPCAPDVYLHAHSRDCYLLSTTAHMHYRLPCCKYLNSCPWLRGRVIVVE